MATVGLGEEMEMDLAISLLMLSGNGSGSENSSRSENSSGSMVDTVGLGEEMEMDPAISLLMLSGNGSGSENSSRSENSSGSMVDTVELGLEERPKIERRKRKIEKEKRFVWTPELHQRFVDAIDYLGVTYATPKSIMELLNIQDISREHIASHLQKYRLYRKNSQGIHSGGAGNSNGVLNSVSSTSGISPQPRSSLSLLSSIKQGNDNSLGSEFDTVSSIGDEPKRKLKRPKLVWTPQLHQRFAIAIANLGIENAVPTAILESMNVEGLTRDQVASHLQKFKLNLEKMKENDGGMNDESIGGEK